MKSGKTRLVGRPLLSRLRRRFAPLRGTQRRCAALFFAPPGRYAPCALRAQPFWKHEKNAGFWQRLVFRLGSISALGTRAGGLARVSGFHFFGQSEMRNAVI